MSLSRFFLPLLIVSSLLFAQQAGIAHTVRHTLTDQKQRDKQTSHSHNCEQCALDAQLGSALHSTAISLALPLLAAAVWTRRGTSRRQSRIRTASARGPPALQRIA